MNQQLAIDLTEKGIKQAEDHANEVHVNWSDTAYNFLLAFIKDMETPFMAEDVRLASVAVIKEPPSKRAWGAVIIRAAKENKIKHMGYSKVKNPRAHTTPASLWQRK